MKIIRRSLEFEWDTGNRGKNFIKHGVRDQECEEVFFDVKKRILKDVLHSGKEARYILIGETKGQRPLFVAFTVRKEKIRVISARGLNKKERYLYEEKN